MNIPSEINSFSKIPISKNIRINENAFLLSFKRTFDFVPGQVVKISLNEHIAPRLYSIASGNRENEVRILYDVVHQGALTPQLSGLEKGDHIMVSKPFGKFICNEEKAYWIATGTGIAPFASMFYSGLSQGKTLIHGGRKLEAFFFADDFSNMQNHYIRCCSREQSNDVYHGRLTKYLTENANLPKDQKYYLCGSAEMVVETRDILISKGVPFHHIIAEIYF